MGPVSRRIGAGGRARYIEAIGSRFPSFICFPSSPQGAIHKSKLHGNGTEAQNVVAGLTTAAAIWVSAAVGIASAVGLYFVGAVATFSTVAILKYARLPKEEEPGFSWKPRALEVDEQQGTKPQREQGHVPQEHSHEKRIISGLFGPDVISGYSPQENAFVDQGIIERYPQDLRRILVKEVMSPGFEQWYRNRIESESMEEKEAQPKAKVLIEEEQEVISYNVTNDDTSMEP